MKNALKFLSLILVAGALAFASCDKSEDETPTDKTTQNNGGNNNGGDNGGNNGGDNGGGTNTPTVQIIDGALPGVFSVSQGQTVHFSMGNLQYRASTSTWRFAEHQWDFVGDAENGNVFDSNGEKCNNNLRGADYTGWIDQFSWGTSGYNGKTPWLTSNSNTDFVWGLVNGEAVHGDIDTTWYDWGAYNQIGDDAPGTWRTITKAQFEYLTRSNSLQGLATVNGVEGHVFLPDEWELPEGLNWTGLPQDYDVNVYTLEEWERMEANGAVFFPKTNNFAPTNPNIAIFGHYWTATGAVGGNNNPVPTSAVDIFFSPYYYNINRSNSFRTRKCCVRLIQYVK